MKTSLPLFGGREEATGCLSGSMMDLAKSHHCIWWVLINNKESDGTGTDTEEGKPHPHLFIMCWLRLCFVCMCVFSIYKIKKIFF